jgi:hypothetical protein
MDANGAIITTVPPVMGMTSFGGTSASTPFIAGIAAMMKALDPSLTSHQVNHYLQDTAWKDSPDANVKFYVNAEDALRRVTNNRLRADAYEPPRTGPFPQGAYNNLTIHEPEDTDAYRLVVPDHSRLDLRYVYDSQLGAVSIKSLQKLKGCGVHQDGHLVSDPAKSRGDYSVGYMPPGTYSLRLTGTDLTAYSLDWRLTPIPAPAHPIDSFEVHDAVTDNNDFARAYFLNSTFERSATLHSDTDVDFYKIESQRETELTPDARILATKFWIENPQMSLKVTLFDAHGQEVDGAESGPECNGFINLIIPKGLYFVKVESPNKGTGSYHFTFAPTDESAFRPQFPLYRSPLKIEIQRLNIESLLTTPAVDYIIVPDGLSKDIVVTGRDLHLSLITLDGTILEEGKPIADVGADKPFGEAVSLAQTTIGKSYVVRLARRDAIIDGNIEGRLEGLKYRLAVNPNSNN